MPQVPKIAIIVSHPIQHFCPLYAFLAGSQEWKIKVFFASAMGLITGYDKGFDKQISWNNLYLHSFDHEFMNGLKSIKSSKNLDAPNLDNHLNLYKPDLIIVYGYYQKIQKRTINWAKKNNVKLAMISDSELRQYRNCVKSTLKLLFLPKIMNKLDAFLTIGDANEDYYLKYGAKPFAFYRMPFPIDLDIYRDAWNNKKSLRQIIRKEHNIADKDIVCSVVGKLIKIKNQSEILHALQMIDLSNRSIKLFIIGSGPMEDELRQLGNTLNNHQVIFTGFVEPNNLPGYYAATDIYIHPSSKDPHPLAISEAIYMGCPIIASNRVGSIGPTDDVQIGKNGFVYPLGDVENLAEKISRLSISENFINSMRDESRLIACNQQKLAYGNGLKAALIGLSLL